MGGSSGEIQDLTSRLVDRVTAYGMEVGTEKSKIMTTNTNNITADISMNGWKLEEVTSFKYLGTTVVQGWHLLSRSLHQDCLSNGSNGQIKQDTAVQRHQLRKQVQVVQVSCHLHPPLRL